MSLLSLELPSPSHLPTQSHEEDSPSSMAAPLISPSSDKRFWSNLRTRVDTLLETRNSDIPINDEGVNRSKRMKEDSMLLIRGFDSIAYSLSQLNGTIDNALQGARDLAKAPTLTEIVQSCTNNGEKESESENGGKKDSLKKRKLREQNVETAEEVDKENPEEKNLKKAKNLAVSMAAKSAFLERELKSVKSEMCFMRERCALLEEENRRLRNKFGEEIGADEEDDLVRLQLEALLGEKSRLAGENANLTRENQCLRQLVEYHQFASQDLSASYEQVVQGLCLDFDQEQDDGGGFGDPETPKTTASFEFPSSEFDERTDKEEID